MKGINTVVLDNISNRLMYDRSMKEWLYLHSNELQKYLDEKVHLTDHSDMWKMFLKNPHIAKVLTENYNMDNDKKLEVLMDKLCNESTIGVIVGIRGGGKTALGCRIAEIAHNEYNKKIYFIQTTIPLPDYIEQVEDPFGVEEGSLIIYDESSVTLNARRSMSKNNVDVSALLAISRHRGFSILFISQHSGLVDVNLLRLADVFIFKRLSWEELNSGEKGTSSLMQYIKLMAPTDKQDTLYTDGERWFNIKMELPTFWSDAVSRSYKKLTGEDATEMAYKLYMQSMHIKLIQQQLKIRGINWTEFEIQQKINRFKPKHI